MYGALVNYVIELDKQNEIWNVDINDFFSVSEYVTFYTTVLYSIYTILYYLADYFKIVRCTYKINQIVLRTVALAVQILFLSNIAHLCILLVYNDPKILFYQKYYNYDLILWQLYLVSYFVYDFIALMTRYSNESNYIMYIHHLISIYIILENIYLHRTNDLYLTIMTFVFELNNVFMNTTFTIKIFSDQYKDNVPVLCTIYNKLLAFTYYTFIVIRIYASNIVAIITFCICKLTMDYFMISYIIQIMLFYYANEYWKIKLKEKLT